MDLHKRGEARPHGFGGENFTSTDLSDDPEGGSRFRADFLAPRQDGWWSVIFFPLFIRGWEVGTTLRLSLVVFRGPSTAILSSQTH